jgi:acyl-coenzyme A synthetase/AMP-(fatty) acid ligase
MIPFLGHSDGARPVACFAGRLISAAEFLADVHQLAEKLPPRAYGVNLCRDRYCFAVAFAAVMVRGQTNLLPPSQTLESLRQVNRTYESAYLLVDDDEDRPFESMRVEVGAGKLAYRPNRLAFDADSTAAIAFTSGSTGTPVPNRKTWGALALGGVSEASRLGLCDRPTTVIIGTVPPQHMYGLESTVIMALRGGLIMHNQRPFFPADIEQALRGIDGDRVLVSTPVHLRALLASEARLPALRLTVCATAPLSHEMAGQFEARFATQVHEVYGFTEAGMVATRRTVDGPKWRLLEGLRIQEEGGRYLVSGGHVPEEAVFNDLVDVVDAEHFILRGRSTDLVNVAGKRTSISYLDHQICGIAGVEDGAFFMPEESGDTVTRLTACAVAPGMTRDQLQAALAERIDPVFLPRPLYLIDALPRNSTGKLPRSELIKLVNKCASASADQPLVIDRTIDAAHPALAGHFPGDPIVPGVILLDEILDAASTGIAREQPLDAFTIRSAKFLRPVRPGDRIQIRLTPAAGNTVRFVCSVGADAAVSGVLALGPTEQA